MAFIKAVRENIWSKVLLIAPSGGGKSYSSLLLASGMVKANEEKTGKKERIAFIGTESSRDKYYANEFDYDILQISAPYTPEKYIDAIQMAIDAEYKFLVIDSTTHEWSGTGGCLEIHSKIPGNSYTAWQKVTPRHNAFLDAMIETPIHVIATVRGKDEYVLEEVNGKTVPRKVALGYSQRDGLEYLFTTSFVVEQDSHVASAVKDNTHIFENVNSVLSTKHGEELYKWATSGDLEEKTKVLESSKEEGKKIMVEAEKKDAGVEVKEEVKVEEVKTISAKEALDGITEESKRLMSSGKSGADIMKVFSDNGFSKPDKSVPIEKLIKALETFKQM